MTSSNNGEDGRDLNGKRIRDGKKERSREGAGKIR